MTTSVHDEVPVPDRLDGRRLRREHNRSAVVDALLSFYGAGEYEPGIAAIAARAGISARSVFRYFDDFDDLTRAAIEAQQQRLDPLWELRLDPDLALGERVVRFVEHRVRLIEAMGHVGRVARLRAHDHPLVGAELARVRERHRSQVAEVFEPELRQLGPARAANRLAAADVACSFEAHELLSHHGLAADDIESVMATTLLALLGSTNTPPS